MKTFILVDNCALSEFRIKLDYNKLIESIPYESYKRVLYTRQEVNPANVKFFHSMNKRGFEVYNNLPEIQVYMLMSILDTQPDCIHIIGATLDHLDLIKFCVDRKIKVFTFILDKKHHTQMSVLSSCTLLRKDDELPSTKHVSSDSGATG